MAAVYQERAVDTITTTTELRNSTQRQRSSDDFSDDDDEEVVLETNLHEQQQRPHLLQQQQQQQSRLSDAESIGSRSSARRRSKREAVKEKRKEDKERKTRDKADKEERKRAKKSGGSGSVAQQQQQQQVPRSVEYEAETIVHTRIPPDNDNDNDNDLDDADHLNNSAVIDAGNTTNANNTRRLLPSNYNNHAEALRSIGAAPAANYYAGGDYSTTTLGSSASYRLDDSQPQQQQHNLNDTSYSRGSYTMSNGGGVLASSTPQRHQNYRNGGGGGGGVGDMQIPVHIERTTQQQTTTTTTGGGGAGGFMPITGSATIARMGPTGSHLLTAPPQVPSSTATPEPTTQTAVGTLKRQQSAKPIPKGQLAIATVALLSDEDQTYECDKRWNGDELYDMVCNSLNLEEREYFGLRFKDREDGVPVWLDLEKPIKKQMTKHAVNDDKWEFEFACKFYPPEPNQLHEDLTRYLLCLQVRSDIIEEKLPCSFVTYAVLGSYLVQSEIGDYNALHHTPAGEYVAEFAIAPAYVQNGELLTKVAELHKQYRGMTPAEADLHYLDQAKRLAFFGVDLHRAEDRDKQQVLLGVNAYGLSVYKEKLRLARFPWPKILKIAYRRNEFHVKLRQGDFEQADTELVYKCPTNRANKRLWKVCVDFHTFFRLRMPEDAKNAPFKFPRFGTSKYRFKGRQWDSNTMGNKNSNMRADTLDRMPPSFERSWSRRTGTTSRSVDAAALLMSDAGTDARRLRSISVQGDGPEYKDAGVGGDTTDENINNADLQRNAYQKIGFSYMDPESLKNARLSQYRGGVGAGTNGAGGGLDGYEREYDVAAGAGGGGAAAQLGTAGYEGMYGSGGMYNERTTRMKTTTSTTKSTLIHSLEPGGGGGGDMNGFGENGEPIVREKVTVTRRVVPPGGAGQPLVTTSSHTYGAEISGGGGGGGGAGRSMLNGSAAADGGADTPLSVETVSSKIRTVETTTYTTDVDGKREMHTTEKVTIMTDGEPIDHDRALAEAIQEATRMNPAMKVEKIEIEEPDND